MHSTAAARNQPVLVSHPQPSNEGCGLSPRNASNILSIRSLLALLLIVILSITPRAFSSQPDTPTLKQISSIHIPGGAEIVSFDPATKKLLAIGDQGLFVYQISPGPFPSPLWHSPFSSAGSSNASATDPSSTKWTPTSIAIDPAGRDFAAAAWIPDPASSAPGMLQIIDLKHDRIIWQMPAHYHPDCIAFTPDGRYLLLANECEPGDYDRAGALSVIDLQHIRSPKDFLGYNNLATFDFSPKNLAPSVTLDKLRISAAHKDAPEIDIEPEYLAADNDGVWVSLQENNALAYFDLHTRLWSRIIPLGDRSFPFDPNDDDGIHVRSAELLAMILEPDTIISLHYPDRKLLLLANEGEQDDEDIIPFEQAVREGRIDADTLVELNAAYEEQALDILGELSISTIDGDIDHDGDIDRPTAIGARGISIYDPKNGSELWSSGAQIELLTALRSPDSYNAMDSRSDRSGPEPEGLAACWIDGRYYAFIGLERTNAVLVYDITNPTRPFPIELRDLDESCSSPEGLAIAEIDGCPHLLVASEKGGCITIFEIRSPDNPAPKLSK